MIVYKKPFPQRIPFFDRLWHEKRNNPLRNPIYFETASYGHMGRNPQIVKKSFVSKSGEVKEIEVELFTWEKLDYVEILKNKFNIQ